MYLVFIFWGDRKMDKIQKLKLDRLIHFFAKEHKETSGTHLFKTTLLKYIDLFEFELLPILGQPPIGLEYCAMKNGSVPIELYDSIDKGEYESDFVEIIQEIEEDEMGGETRKIKIIPKPMEDEYDFDDFSEIEIDKMYELIELYAKGYQNNKKIIDKVHQLKSWKIAWEKAPQKGKKIEKIDFSDEIDSERDPILTEQYKSYRL